MMRSLFAGASGVRNHQIRMDVIGDNIANVNTLGFKSSRVQFSTVLAQSLAGATAPSENRGGTNAMQVGLGSTLGAIDTTFQQGSLQSTGIISDLSIEGEGLFILGSGSRRFYTRAGAFRFDANGLLTDPATGYGVMGYNADTAGTINPSGEIEPVTLPFGQAAQARATTDMTLGGNLNADSAAQGSVYKTAVLKDQITGNPSTVTTILSNLQNSAGENLGLGDTDIITISGRVGGTEITPVDYVVGAASQVSDLLGEIETALGLTTGMVTLNADGSLRVEGDPGLSAELTNLRITATDTTGTVPRSIFNQAMGMTAVQTARDAESYAMSKTVYDSLGFEHTVTITMNRQQGTGEWNWSATVDGDATVTAGATGTVRFGNDGTLEAFGYDGGAVGLTIDPGNGANSLQIELDPGSMGSLTGLTQFATSSNAMITSQDGYGMGDLESVSIDQNGIIVGVFTNGVSRNLAQIAVAQFANPGGLQRAEGNTFVGSANSGVPLIGVVGSRIPGRIQPGTLEMSNVDLALEFTNMVITQRGFQANARIISTADDMLTELVNLKR
jgi:flagellar hook protein FlgE